MEPLPRTRRGGSRLSAAVAATALAAGLATTLTACGDGDAGDTGDAGTGRSWPSPASGIDNSGLVYAVDTTVHLGDGTTLDAGRPFGPYVVGEGAVYAESMVDDATDSEPGPLLRITGDGADELDVHPLEGSLATSRDGRYLGFIDMPVPEEGGSQEAGEAVVVDLREGRELVRTGRGMGEESIPELYSELEPTVLGFDDARGYVLTTDDVLAVDLDSGRISQVQEGRDGLSDLAALADIPPSEEPLSPDGSWRIVEPPRDPRGAPLAGRTYRFAGPQGQDVAARLGQVGDPNPYLGTTVVGWGLSAWIDERTAVGTATVGDEIASGTRRVLITCTVPDGACAQVEDAGDEARLPTGDGVIRRPLAGGGS